MAVVTTTIEPTLQALPWTNQGEDVRLALGSPRAELRYSVYNEQIASPGVGNTRKAVVNCDLPKGFGYALMDVNCRIETSSLNPWELLSTVEITDDVSDPDYSIGMQLKSEGEINKTQVYESCSKLPSIVLHPVLPAANSTPRLQATFIDDSDDGTSTSLYWFARFLVYDITQAYDSRVNRAVATR